MARLSDVRDEVVAALLDSAPAGGPGPIAGNPFERIARVLIGRLAEGRTADRAIDALDLAGLLAPGAMAGIGAAELDDLFREVRVRPLGKDLGPLRRVAAWVDRGGLGPEGEDGPSSRSTEAIRDELRELRGVGPATADAILLRALDRPTYPVDRATFRVLARHGWIDPSAEYDEARAAAELLAPGDPSGLARVGEAMERLGRSHCKAGAPRCDCCPLRPWLPEGGPLGAE